MRIELPFVASFPCLLLLACSPEVPTKYGIYARDRSGLVDLTDQAAADDWRLSSKTAVVIYERELSEPAFSPSEGLQLFNTAYSRQTHTIALNVNPTMALKLVNRGPGNVHSSEVSNLPASSISVQPSGEWVTTAVVPTRLEPLNERRDMLALVPASPLSSGTYLVTAELGQRKVSARFGVDISSSEAKRQNATCIDEFLYTARRPSEFVS